MTFRKTATENNVEYLFRLGLYGFVVLLLVYRLCIVFSFKHELLNGESNNLWNAMNVAHGKRIYSNPEALPLEVFQYTPLSQFPLIAFAYVLDDSSPNYLYLVTMLGRLTALTANILTVLLIYRFLIKFFNSDSFSASAIAVLGFSTLTHASFTVRPDALTLLVCTFLLLKLVCAVHDRNTKLICYLSALTAAAMLFKQDAFYILVPIGIILFLDKNWSSLFGLILFFLLGVVFCFTVGNFLFGPYFLLSVGKGIQNPASITQAMYVFERAFGFFGLQLCLAVVIAAFVLTQKWNDKKLVNISVVSLSFILFSFTSTLKLGSGVSYYTPAVLFSTILLGVFLDRIKPFEHKKVFFFFLAIVIGSTFLIRQLYVYTMPYLRDQNARSDYYRLFEDSKKIEGSIKVTSNDYILVPNQLMRNFLFKRSSLVNLEYYGVSQFDYTNVRGDMKDHLKYIISTKGDSEIIEYLGVKFSFRVSDFDRKLQINQFRVYERK